MVMLVLLSFFVSPGSFSLLRRIAFFQFLLHIPVLITIIPNFV